MPGVGEKTASKLIAGYGGLDGIYEHLDEQTPRLRQNLEDHKDQAFLNRRLMRLVRDVPFPDTADGTIALEAFTLRDWEREEVRRVFDGLAFRTLWDRLVQLGGQAEVVHEVLEVEVSSVTSSEGLDDLVGPLVVDSVHHLGELSGLMVAAPGGGRFIPTARLDVAAARARTDGIIAHDAKPLVRIFLDGDLPPPAVVFDTAMAAYLVNPAQRTPDLAELAYRELGLDVDAGGDDAASAPQGTLNFDSPEGPDLEGVARRVTAIDRLLEKMNEQIDSRGGRDLLIDIELPLIPISPRWSTRASASTVGFSKSSVLTSAIVSPSWRPRFTMPPEGHSM